MAPVYLPSAAAAFPTRLSSIPDPPTGLWVAGDPHALPPIEVRALAIVGSRAATHDALDRTRVLAGGLARAGVVIVSGLARGVDAAAHQAALDAGGRTVAVLGSGLARIYPPEHAGLATAIGAAGAVVSEYPPATVPRPWLFPRRNRLICGLADAVLVVEAPERSGALITASAALDQGKDVMVVPGRVEGGRNRGGHQLIRDGATLVETLDDILQEMGWAGGAPSGGAGDEGGAAPVAFTVDEYSRQTGAPAEAVLARLLQLELDGVVQRIGSARFLRVRGRVLT